MTDFSDLTAATRAVTDPSTSAADLAQIAQAQPGLRAQVAAHPQVYPGLLDWLDQYGDDAVKQAVAARRDAAAAMSAPSVPTSAPTPSAPGSAPATSAPSFAPAQSPQPDPQPGPGYAPQTPAPDAGSGFGWGVLGFFVPVVGLILFLVWRGKRPKASRGAGVGALIGAVLWVVMAIVSTVIGVSLLTVFSRSATSYTPPATSTQPVVSATPTGTGQPTPPNGDNPPSDMPSCSAQNWTNGTNYDTAAAFGQWTDAQGNVVGLLICQGTGAGYGIVRHGNWSSYTLTDFYVTLDQNGDYITYFVGGDLDGVQITLFSNMMYAVQGSLLSYLANTGSGGQTMSEGYFPNGGSGSGSGASPTSSPSYATAGTQVLNLQSLILQNSSDRPSLASAIPACDANTIQSVLTDRQTFYAALQNTAVDQIPNGDQLIATLTQAIDFSVQSDRSYLGWAEQGCPKPVPTLASDSGATSAKTQFVNLWNSQIAGVYTGAQQLQVAQL